MLLAQTLAIAPFVKGQNASLPKANYYWLSQCYALALEEIG